MLNLAWDSAFRLINRLNLLLNYLQSLAGEVGEELATSILNAEQKDEADIYEQRDRITQLKNKLQTIVRANDRSPTNNPNQTTSVPCRLPS